MLTNHLKKMIEISLITIGLSACACDPHIIHVPVEIARPVRPVLPKVSVEEANKIPYPVWTKIVYRNLLLRQYAENLETIIDSTKNKDK